MVVVVVVLSNGHLLVFSLLVVVHTQTLDEFAADGAFLVEALKFIARRPNGKEKEGLGSLQHDTKDTTTQQNSQPLSPRAE